MCRVGTPLLYNTHAIGTREPFGRDKEKDDYTISDHVSQHFVMLLGETMTCRSYHQNKRPKILKYDSFIMPLEQISSKLI